MHRYTPLVPSIGERHDTVHVARRTAEGQPVREVVAGMAVHLFGIESAQCLYIYVRGWGADFEDLVWDWATGISSDE